ncbi:hypothetical protein XENORESO_010882, partial [Xenotaenia resolanae]
MGGQTVLSEAEGAELCTSETSVYSSLSLKAHQRPGGMDKLLRRCRIRTPIVRECLAECLGVYVLIVGDHVSGKKWPVSFNQPWFCFGGNIRGVCVPWSLRGSPESCSYSELVCFGQTSMGETSFIHHFPSAWSLSGCSHSWSAVLR